MIAAAPQGEVFLFAAVGLFAGLMCLFLGVELLHDTRRMNRDGIPVTGTVTIGSTGFDGVTEVEYQFGAGRYRSLFQNYCAKAGDAVELLVDPKAPSRALLKNQMRARRAFFGCMTVFGVLCLVAGAVGLAFFFLDRASH